MSDVSRTPRSLLHALRPARMGVLGLAVVATALLTEASVSVQTPMVPPQKVGDVARVGGAEAREVAKQALEGSPVTVGDGLEVRVWATGHLVADALALDIDANGVVYVGATPRGSQWLDTRQHPDWVPEVNRLKTTEELRQFFREKMATELSDKNTWITDFNNDGVRDYRDVMVVEEKIYKIEDTDADGMADKSTLVFSGFNEDLAADILGGIMVHESGDIYATIAPDLWRLRDTNGDGTLDFKESISHGYSVHPSFSGHDMSALTQGPDGMIYWKIGEIGMNVVDKTGKRWAHPHTGAVLRSNPDGTDFEVYAYGVRNPQEIAFDDFGNLISVDNDGDYPGETERVIYIAEGSDTGWRSNWQFGKYTDANNNRYLPWMDEGLSKVRFDGQMSYVTPPIAPAWSGPSGFAFNPGTALDPRFKNHFFVTSFTGNATNARVIAFTLKPSGAGFALGETSDLVRGVLSPGMKIGPDGAMYLTDWIRGWGPTGEGRIWKLDSIAGAGSAARAEVKTLLVARFADRPVAGLAELLRHEDQRVRLKAQFELVRRGEGAATLTTVAQSREHQLARVHAIWGLGQLLRSGGVQPSAITPFLTDADAEIRTQAAKVLGHARSTAAASALVPLLADQNARVRAFSAVALGRLAFAPAMQPVVAMIAANNDQDVYLRNAGIVALEGIGNRAALAALSTHESRAVRLAAVVALRRLRDAGVAGFLADRDLRVVTEAASAINDEGGIAAAVPALALTLERADLAGDGLVRRAISANLRVGDAAAVTRISTFAQRPGLSEVIRVEAISVLGVWAAPSNLDRVDGAWLGPAAQRSSDAAQAAVVALAGVLTAPNTTPAIKIAWLEAAAKIGAKSQAAPILARLRTDSEPTVRVAALRALQTLGVTELSQGVQSAMADSNATVRMAAISAMPSMPLDNAAKVQHLVAVVGKGAPGEQQSAIGALGQVQGPEAAQALSRLADGVAAGSVAPAVQLDVFDAMRASSSDTLLARLDQLKVARDLSGLATAYPAALTSGGNIARGRQLVTQHPAAQCSRCHTVGNSTSDVGPNLNNIGSRLTRDQLLQALLEPSARLAPGFGQVSVTLKNGQKIEGTLREESATALAVEDATRGLQRIAVTDIATRENGVSAMPPMGFMLTPREVRDIVEALANQK